MGNRVHAKASREWWKPGAWACPESPLSSACEPHICLSICASSGVRAAYVNGVKWKRRQRFFYEGGTAGKPSRPFLGRGGFCF